MSDRPMAFDSGYHMMWSLLDSVTPAQIQEEIPLLEKTIRECDIKIGEANNVRQVKQAKLRVLKELLERDYNKRLRNEFKLTEDHKKIIKAIDWESERPYGYFYDKDVCELLGWEKPNDDYSTAQLEAAFKLLKEIPIAVNRFFGDNK